MVGFRSVLRVFVASLILPLACGGDDTPSGTTAGRGNIQNRLSMNAIKEIDRRIRRARWWLRDALPCTSFSALGMLITWFRRFASTVVVALLAGALALSNVACARSLAARYPHARMVKVCGRALDVEVDALRWVCSEEGMCISDMHEEVFDRMARSSRMVFEYDPESDSRSVLRMPSPHDEVRCRDRFSILPPPEVKDEWLPPSEVLLADEQRGCTLFAEEAADESKAAAFFGQPLPKKGLTGGCMGPGPLTVRQQTIAAVRGHLQDLGRQYGAAFGELNETLSNFPPLGPKIGLRAFLNTHPDIVRMLITGLDKKLNAIPELPTYDDPELAAVAARAFELGYGASIAEAQLRSLTVLAGFELLHMVTMNVAVLAESASGKAFNAAMTRIRGMPLFVPGTAGGVGFFLRPKALPKPPPANANAPALKPGTPTPPATAPPPFGNLSRAAEFGVKTYNQLRIAVKGTGLEVHHLIEQRFLRYFNGDERINLSVAVTAAEHQAFTNKWHYAIGYGNAGTNITNKEAILTAARDIYKNYPAILRALDL
ncbi:MAG: hypothetical protein IPM54_11270 [Polyangiaceae bacterium]|nr:hypothetical protein [Polyangiaceae bacterium]